jgi:Zn-dependent protease with chaperone function
MSFPTVEIRPRRSMAFFAILSIAMVIASYLFVLSLAVACVWVPGWIMTSTDTGGFQILLILLFGIAAAGAMIWSLVPRFEAFKAPGLLLDGARHPRLFAELDSIAAALKQPMPREVYLIGQVNAWVADRGGFVGIGSRRVMGVGLPLLAVLSVSQLRAVLAHEFAHYYGGDTRLGPWVYRAQVAIIRSQRSVGALRGWTRVLIVRMMYEVITTLMTWQFKVFLRCIRLSSRQQEYRADELACLIAGRQALVDGLRAIDGAAPAWTAFWRAEIAPILEDGLVPGIADGFARFVTAPAIREQIERNLETQIRESKTDPYATHPPLRQRIAAAERVSAGQVADDPGPARGLLSQPEVTEVQFLESMNPALKPGALTPVGWDDVALRFTIPRWRRVAAANSSILEGFLARSLPDRLTRLKLMEGGTREPEGVRLDAVRSNAVQTFGIGLALALIDGGWTLHVEPGDFHLRRGAHRLNPFQVVHELMTGRLSALAWNERCAEMELGGIGLDRPSPEAPPPAPPQG